MKRNALILFSLFIILSAGSLFGQSVAGNYDLVGVVVEYTYVARDTATSAGSSGSMGGDSVATYDVTASWPSASSPAYVHTLKTFSVGDTVGVILVPLPGPQYLLGFPYGSIALNLDMNDDGTFIINTGSTYPTTGMENCSTSATVPPVQENGTWVWGGDPIVDQAEHTLTWGWGITLSGVFAQFLAPDMANEVHGVDYGVGTAMPNWGMMKAYYDANFTAPHVFNLYWEAHDGSVSGLGIDQNEKFNGHVGIATLDGDVSTVAALKATANPNLHVGTHPIIGGTGVDLDGDGNPDGVIEDINWGYMFDPAGRDGALFSGDEPLQFTGYYFTYNFLSAVGLFDGLFKANYAVTGDLAAAFIFAADSTLKKFGAPAAFSAAVANAIDDSLTTWIGAGVAAYMAAGMSQADATVKATEDALKAGLLKSIGGTALQAQATNLYFSEYIEGGSNNKALEIYNGTGKEVDLSGYSILTNYNGNSWSGEHTFPAGATLANGDVWVLANSGADASVLAVADQSMAWDSSGYVVGFNGDDVRALVTISGTDTTIHDIIGLYDLVDPGSGWDVAGVTTATKDHTLVRKSTVKSGNTDWTAAAGTDATSSEWTVLDKDTFTDLGKHTSLYTGWNFPNDSDHDFDGVSGRLVFEIGNNCIPDNTTQRVNAWFENTGLTVASDESLVPDKFALYNNFPNPFNPTTRIVIDLPDHQNVEITVWNLMGQKVATLHSGELNAGTHSLIFEGRDANGNTLSSGMYFYRVEAGPYQATKKMMLLK